MKGKADRKLSYEEKYKKCEEFLKTFEDYDMGDSGQAYLQYGRKKYMIEIVSLLLNESKRSLTERARSLRLPLRIWSRFSGRKMRRRWSMISERIRSGM